MQKKMLKAVEIAIGGIKSPYLTMRLEAIRSIMIERTAAVGTDIEGLAVFFNFFHNIVRL